MKLSKWIRSRAATQQPLNLHAVTRERPDLLELAFAGPTPRGWRRSLMDAGSIPTRSCMIMNRTWNAPCVERHTRSWART